jgi:Domain of unknown function (DUF4214)/RTX calcium-binding nonapeptide repeat (4 copies)
MPITTQAAHDISRLYIATFNRVPDTGGLFYWLDRNSNGLTMLDMAGLFMNSEEAKATYPDTLSDLDFIDRIYQNALGRQADLSGKVTWKAQLEQGMARSTFIDTIIKSAMANGSNDGKILENKAEYGMRSALDGIDVAVASAKLPMITTELASVDAASIFGKTYVLTTGVDGLVGSAGNDTYSGTALTAQTTDSINGGVGTDTLMLNGTTVLPSLTSVENVIFENVSGSVNASTKTGVTTVSFNGNASDMEVLLSATQSVGVTNTTGTGIFSLLYAKTAALATIILDKAGSSSSKTVIDLVDGTVVKAFKLTTQNNDSYVTLDKSGSSPVTSLTITGDKMLTLDMSSPNLIAMKTVDASASTGGVALTLANIVDVIYSVKGGLGNDTFDFADKLTATDVIDGGARIDTIKVYGSATSTTDASLKNIEVFTLTAATTLNLAGQTENFTVNGSSGNDNITTGTGLDTIYGGAGDDTIYSGNAGLKDKIDGGDGNDTIITQGDLTLVGDSYIVNVENITMGVVGTLNLSDQTEAFTIRGSSGADAITCSSGGDTIMFATAASNGIDAITFSVTDGGAISDILDLTANSAFIGTTTSSVVVVPDDTSATVAASGDNILILTGNYFSSTTTLSAIPAALFTNCNNGNVVIVYSSNATADARMAVATIDAAGAITSVTDIATLVGLNITEASTGFSNSNFILD